MVKNPPTMQETACDAEDPDSVPGLGRSPGVGNGYPSRYSCLENSMDGRTWWTTQSMGSQSRTQLNNQAHLLLYDLDVGIREVTSILFSKREMLHGKFKWSNQVTKQECPN